MMSYRARYKAVGYLFLLPAIAVFVTFIVYPAIASLIYSLRLLSPFGDRWVFVGFSNYLELFASARYVNSLRVTAVFVLGTVGIGLPLSLAVSLLLSKKVKGIGVYRTAFFLPLALSPAMAAVVWLFLLNPNVGYLNYLLSLVGIRGPHWRTDPTWALPALIMVTVWKELGFNTIVFVAGLQNVSDDLYEAAEIDGARSWARFRYITIPMISPTIFFLFVTAIIRSFEGFGAVDMLTGGGPSQATNLLVYNLYRDAFVSFNTGLASAQAYLIFMIILAVTLVQFRVLGKRVHYQ